MPNSSKPQNWRDVLPIHPAAELFPLMSEVELRELGEDIKTHGLKSHLKLHKGKLLDGRNRLEAMELVGIPINWIDDVAALGCPFDHLGEQVDPYEYVISVNLYRRHLTGEQKRDLIAKLIKQTPNTSDRQIAKQTKTSPTTVGKIRKKSEATGDVSKLDTRTDTKGRKQPSAKPKRSLPAKSQRGSVSARDGALEDFSARAMELVRLTRNKHAERFAKTALSDENIGYLAKFFTDLARIRQGSSGSTRQSAEVSTEQHTNEHAALDEAGAP